MKTFNNFLICKAPVLLYLLCFAWISNLLGQVKEISVKDLAQESTAILIGKCTQKYSYWDANKTKILTSVKITVDEYLKGDLGTEAELIVPGGRVGNIIYEVSEMPVFEEGEDLCVFAWRHPTGKYLVNGGVQGKLTIQTDKITGEKTIQGFQIQKFLKQKQQGKNSLQNNQNSKMELGDFVKEIKDHLEKTTINPNK